MALNVNRTMKLQWKLDTIKKCKYLQCGQKKLLKSQKSHFESFLYGMWQNPIYARRKKAILHFTYDKKLHSTLLQLAQVQ